MGTFLFFARAERTNPGSWAAKKMNPPVFLAGVLFLWKLWGTDLWAPDEPYFAEGAREMVVDGRWAVPHVNGVVTTDKPPLFFWLLAVFSLPFGPVPPLATLASRP